MYKASKMADLIVAYVADIADADGYIKQHNPLKNI